MKIIDITRPITRATAVWPGDTAPQLDWSARLEEGSPVNIGIISLSTHTSTHVDAPLHYQTDGHSVDQYSLEPFIGSAYVWHAPSTDVIRPGDLDGVPAEITRLLVRTDYSDLPGDKWSDEFAAFDPQTIVELASRGCRLIATDAPSFDPADSTNLDAHHALAEHHIANIENVVLSDVESGWYHLIAMPLLLAGMDAAPVRAVLIEGDEGLHINVTARH
jgi:arylformamidase